MAKVFTEATPPATRENRTSEAAHSLAAVGAGAPASAAPPPHFAVELKCPTPLTLRRVVVAAETPALAWKCYCDLNGISGSDWERSIEPTTEPLTELPK